MRKRRDRGEESVYQRRDGRARGQRADGPWTELGATIRRERIAKNWIQEVLGEAAGCSGAYIGQIELGDKQPARDLVINIALALELDPDPLLQGFGWSGLGNVRGDAGLEDEIRRLAKVIDEKLFSSGDEPINKWTDRDKRLLRDQLQQTRRMIEELGDQPTS